MNYLKYNLGWGLPPNHLINSDNIVKAMNYGLRENICVDKENRLYNYSDPRGDKLVRDTVSQWYSKQIKCNVSPNNIVITFGATIGILSVCCALLPNRGINGDVLLVECPGFFPIYKMFKDQGFNLVSLKREKEGCFNFSAFEELLIKRNGCDGNKNINIDFSLKDNINIKNDRIRAFYLVTNFSNPLGYNLKLNERSKLYELAHKYKFYVISDDIYELLYFNESIREIPLFFCDKRSSIGETQHLTTYDNNSTYYIVSINSFNKAICPSVRTGFVHGHKDIINKILDDGVLYAPCGLVSYNQFTVSSYIKLGYMDDHLKKQREFLKKNMNIAVKILMDNIYIKNYNNIEQTETNKKLLEKNDNKLYSFNIPDGGYFIFLYLNELIDIDKVNKLQSSYEINYIKGIDTIPNMFRNLYPEFKFTIRLAISCLKPDLLQESLYIFIELLNDCIIK